MSTLHPVDLLPAFGPTHFTMTSAMVIRFTLPPVVSWCFLGFLNLQDAGQIRCKDPQRSNLFIRDIPSQVDPALPQR